MRPSVVAVQASQSAGTVTRRGVLCIQYIMIYSDVLNSIHYNLCCD